jgi:hypothetical protein
MSLSRVKGMTTWGETWSVFVKSIGSPRHWPFITVVPEDMREEFILFFPWRAELDAHSCGLPLPDGLRLPRLFHADSLGDDRVVLWMEDVRMAPQEWTLPRYRTLAYAGVTEAGDLPEIHTEILTAYTEGSGGDPGEVAFGYAATSLLRCGFSALPGELLDQEPTPALDELFRKRMGLARFIADLGLRMRV